MSVSRAGHNSVELFFGPRTACRLSFSGGTAIGPKIAFFFAIFLFGEAKRKLDNEGSLYRVFSVILKYNWYKTPIGSIFLFPRVLA